jgi:hypothetical protein
MSDWLSSDDRWWLERLPDGGLKDCLNDCAVIRTTFEMLDVFPDDTGPRGELMEIIDDARGQFGQRLTDLSARIPDDPMRLCGKDRETFRNSVLTLPESVGDPANYASKDLFDNNVFQRLLAVIAVKHAPPRGLS